MVMRAWDGQVEMERKYESMIYVRSFQACRPYCFVFFPSR